jgi:glycosyltransferase involved in cell wall biosynthesis
MKISVIIPVYPPHFIFIPKILDQLKKQTLQPDEIIIAASEINNNFELINIINNPKVKLITTQEKQPAGMNRNMGMNASTGDIILFMDADDIYHKEKIEITNYYFQKYNCDLFLHSYCSMFRTNYEKALNINLVINRDCYREDTELLYKQTFITPRIRDNETGVHGDTNIRSKIAIHHGVIAIDKKMKEKYKYTDMIAGEDGKFCRDILEDKNNVIAADLKLMFYCI